MTAASIVAIFAILVAVEVVPFVVLLAVLLTFLKDVGQER